MKITDIAAWVLTGSYVHTWDDVDRVCRPLDMYDDYCSARPDRTKSVIGSKQTVNLEFIEIQTDEGLSGFFGPLAYRSEIIIIMELLKKCVIGQDPLNTEIIWDRMSKADRHARSGFMMMAISAVDNALWDLKGKYYQKPVYRLLGGNRTSYRVYGSMLGNSTLPERAAELAVKVKNMGHPAQKWFFPWGPKSAEEGMRDNAALAAALREALGADYPLMFDAWMGWNIPYAQKMCALLEPYTPSWLEEPLPPQMLKAYAELKKRITIPLAAGEHLYTTWDVQPYLENGILSVVQADPDWCGGISELLRIGTLCRNYGIPLIPHGMGVHAAAHVIAALPESVCPMGEYLFTYMERETCLFKYPLKPENGRITLRDDVYGLGLDIDEAKVEKKVPITL